MDYAIKFFIFPWHKKLNDFLFCYPTMDTWEKNTCTTNLTLKYHEYFLLLSFKFRYHKINLRIITTKFMHIHKRTLHIFFIHTYPATPHTFYLTYFLQIPPSNADLFLMCFLPRSLGVASPLIMLTLNDHQDSDISHININFAVAKNSFVVDPL